MSPPSCSWLCYFCHCRKQMQLIPAHLSGLRLKYGPLLSCSSRILSPFWTTSLKVTLKIYIGCSYIMYVLQQQYIYIM